MSASSDQLLHNIISLDAGKSLASMGPLSGFHRPWRLLSTRPSTRWAGISQDSERTLNLRRFGPNATHAMVSTVNGQLFVKVGTHLMRASRGSLTRSGASALPSP